MRTTARHGAEPAARPEEATAEPARMRPDQPASPAPSRTTMQIAPFSIVLFAVAFWLLPLLGFFFARFIDVLLTIFLAVLFSTFLTPIVNILEKVHIPRWIGVILVYLAIAGMIFVVGQLAVPLFTQETRRLVSQLPADLHRLSGPLHRFGIDIPTPGGKGFNANGLIASLFSGGGHEATGIAGQAIGVVFTIGTLVVAILAILVMAFLLTVQKTFTADVVTALLPPDYRQRTTHLLNRMGERMGGWVIGQIVVTIYYAVAFSLGLHFLDVPDAVSIGVISGVLEIIPFIGGFMGLALAVIVAASVHPILVVWVLILYLIVTNVEAHVLVPFIYAHSVHIHPVLVVVSLLFGAVAFGVIGAVIAVPVAAAIQVVVENLYIKDVVESDKQPPRPHLKQPLIDVARLRRMRARRTRGFNAAGRRQ